MDDFEQRLRHDLGAAGMTVGATDGLTSAVRRRVRRRKTIAGAAAAVPLVALIAGAAWLLPTNDDAADLDTAVTPPTAPAPTSDPPATDPPTSEAPDPLREALVELGVDIAAAPEGTTELAGASWCGVDRSKDLSAGDANLVALTCLWQAWQDGSHAVALSVLTTIEGDPIVEVLRSDPAGHVVRWVDATRDAFGSGAWEGPFWCTGFDVVDGRPNGPVDCTDARPGEASGGDVIASVAPGESVEVAWPDQAFLGGADRRPLYLLEDVAPGGTPRWALAGEARANADGTATLNIAGPTRAAGLAGSEFSPVEFAGLPAGDYRLSVETGGDMLRDQGNPVSVRLTEGFDADPGPVGDVPLPRTDPATALLGPAGVGSVTFGTSRADTIAALEAQFGVPVTYVPFSGCVTTGYAIVGDFLVVEFWGDEAGTESGFVAWYHGGTNPFDSGQDPVPLTDSGLTTTNGIRVGSAMADIENIGGGFSGGYDRSWGADIWFESDNVGGRLSADITDPTAAVVSLSGGRTGTPARMVC